jgi:hypothetical protein
MRAVELQPTSNDITLDESAHQVLARSWVIRVRSVDFRVELLPWNEPDRRSPALRGISFRGYGAVRRPVEQLHQRLPLKQSHHVQPSNLPDQVLA